MVSRDPRDVAFWQKKLREAEVAQAVWLAKIPPPAGPPPTRRECRGLYDTMRSRWVGKMKAERAHVHQLKKLARRIAFYRDRIDELLSRSSRVLRKPVV